MKLTLSWLWYAAIAAAIIVMVAGVLLGHSNSFKSHCADRKIYGSSMGWFKNTVCDMNFEIG
jgi:hypothetical protein